MPNTPKLPDRDPCCHTPGPSALAPPSSSLVLSLLVFVPGTVCCARLAAVIGHTPCVVSFLVPWQGWGGQTLAVCPATRRGAPECFQSLPIMI